MGILYNLQQNQDRRLLDGICKAHGMRVRGFVLEAEAHTYMGNTRVSVWKDPERGLIIIGVEQGELRFSHFMPNTLNIPAR